MTSLIKALLIVPCRPIVVSLLLVLSTSAVAASNSMPGDEQAGKEQIQAWISAIGNDRADKLEAMFTRYHPEPLLARTASNGKSALMVASKKGDLALVKLLVNAGARIDDVTITNGTAFMFAVLGNQKPVAEWLMAEGADINIAGSNGWTALTIAAAKGYQELLQWLIDNGAQAQVRDVYRYTPLMRAVENNHTEAVELLLSLDDTDVNVQDEYDNSSLHHAVSVGNAPMIRLLLEAGADATLSNRDGLTAPELARGKPDLENVLSSELPLK